ncbi:unnamed protein product [Pedinophyceae sp. YPF-701]|nr:unnamed protein product [Pedinophyceae sp. YPF-701]
MATVQSLSELRNLAIDILRRLASPQNAKGRTPNWQTPASLLLYWDDAEMLLTRHFPAFSERQIEAVLRALTRTWPLHKGTIVDITAEMCAYPMHCPKKNVPSFFNALRPAFLPASSLEGSAAGATPRSRTALSRASPTGPRPLPRTVTLDSGRQGSVPDSPLRVLRHASTLGARTLDPVVEQRPGARSRIQAALQESAELATKAMNRAAAAARTPGGRAAGSAVSDLAGGAEAQQEEGGGDRTRGWGSGGRPGRGWTHVSTLVQAATNEGAKVVEQPSLQLDERAQRVGVRRRLPVTEVRNWKLWRAWPGPRIVVGWRPVGGGWQFALRDATPPVSPSVSSENDSAILTPHSAGDSMRFKTKDVVAEGAPDELREIVDSWGPSSDMYLAYLRHLQAMRVAEGLAPLPDVPGVAGQGQGDGDPQNDAESYLDQARLVSEQAAREALAGVDGVPGPGEEPGAAARAEYEAATGPRGRQLDPAREHAAHYRRGEGPPTAEDLRRWYHGDLENGRFGNGAKADWPTTVDEVSMHVTQNLQWPLGADIHGQGTFRTGMGRMRTFASPQHGVDHVRLTVPASSARRVYAIGPPGGDGRTDMSLASWIDPGLLRMSSYHAAARQAAAAR